MLIYCFYCRKILFLQYLLQTMSGLCCGKRRQGEVLVRGVMDGRVKLGERRFVVGSSVKDRVTVATENFKFSQGD